MEIGGIGKDGECAQKLVVKEQDNAIDSATTLPLWTVVYNA